MNKQKISKSIKHKSDEKLDFVVGFFFFLSNKKNETLFTRLFINKGKEKKPVNKNAQNTNTGNNVENKQSNENC